MNKSIATLSLRLGVWFVLALAALQLLVMLKLLAPELLILFIQPLCYGLSGMLAYALWVLFFAAQTIPSHTQENEATDFDWQSLLTLTALVCFVSYASAALNATYGQQGLWIGAVIDLLMSQNL